MNALRNFERWLGALLGPVLYADAIWEFSIHQIGYGFLGVATFGVLWFGIGPASKP